MFQNGQKVVVVSSGDERRVIKVQAASSLDTGRYPTVDTTGVTGRDQQVQIVSGGDETRFPKLQGLADARSTADSVITALTPAAWYRNATGVTSAGGFASQWDDYSGNTRHLVQGTGTNQPAYNATGGIFTFDGADNWMEAVYTAAKPRTRYIVFSQISWTNNDYIMDGASVNTAVLNQQAFTPEIRAMATNISASSAVMTLGAYGIVCVVFNGAASVLRVNNEADIVWTSDAITTGGIMVASNGTGGGTFGNVAVKEIIDFAAAHDTTTQSSVITALNNALTVF